MEDASLALQFHCSSSWWLFYPILICTIAIPIHFSGASASVPNNPVNPSNLKRSYEKGPGSSNTFNKFYNATASTSAATVQPTSSKVMKTSYPKVKVPQKLFPNKNFATSTAAAAKQKPVNIPAALGAPVNPDARQKQGKIQPLKLIQRNTRKKNNWLLMLIKRQLYRNTKKKRKKKIHLSFLFYVFLSVLVNKI